MPILIPFLLCLLLCGCAPASAEITEASPPVTLAADILEYGGRRVSGYTLEGSPVLFSMEDGWLLVSAEGELTLLTDDLTIQATAQWGGEKEMDSFRVWDTAAGIACYDHGQRQLLFFTEELTESRRVTLPQNITSPPVVSEDGESIYYAIPGALYRWDLTSGIRRRIQELDTEDLTLVALHRDDSILQCDTKEKSLFFHTEDGRLCHSTVSPIRLTTRGEEYYAVFSSGLLKRMVFGSDSGVMGLYPEDLSAEGYFLPESRLAITRSGQQLEVYDLDNGQNRDGMTLEPGHTLQSLHSGGEGTVVLLIADGETSLLLFWQPDMASGGESYLEDYFPDDQSENVQMALCRDYARELEERFGIAIHIGKEAAACSPWDYQFQPELQTPVILRMLTVLADSLSQFPESVLRDTATQFDSLQLCLVRTIAGQKGDSSLDAATGLQFFDGKNAYLAIAASNYAGQSLYHELFHVMETRIFSTSNALDDWDQHNPAGFSYALDYGSNADRSVYLSGQHRAFVDHYSMSYPKEDRARIFEYAILPNQEGLFQSDSMQEKLKAICTGIREAYGLEKYEEELLWEQYLDN